MKITKPFRATRSFTQHLVAEPAVVFPLLCPVLEADWIEDWNPISVFTFSGVAEQDCVFITADDQSEAIWVITRHDPENGFVEMIKINPLITACRLTIQLRAIETGSEAFVTYSHTSLGPEGDAFVESFTEEYYRQFMQDWESRLNHFLSTGSALRVAGG